MLLTLIPSADEARRRCAHGQQQSGFQPTFGPLRRPTTSGWRWPACLQPRSIEYLPRVAYVSDHELWSARARGRVRPKVKLRQRRAVAVRFLARPTRARCSPENRGQRDRSITTKSRRRAKGSQSFCDGCEGDGGGPDYGPEDGLRIIGGTN
jgi:hypothetical protein